MTIREYIEQAIDESRTIEIEYVKYDGTSSKRSISDLSYSGEYGDDYIVGYCHLREEYRTFKISRIRRIDGKSFSLVSSNVSAGKTAYTGKTAYSSQTTSNLSPTPTPSTLNTPRVTPTTSSYKPKQTYSSSSYASPKKSEGWMSNLCQRHLDVYLSKCTTGYRRRWYQYSQAMIVLTGLFAAF